MKTNGNILRKLLFIIFAIFIIMSNFNIVEADESLLKKMEGQADKFLSTGATQASGKIDTSKIAENFVGLGQILTMVGAGVLVAVTTYMGIKYLTAGPEAQAKLKVQLIGVVVSGVVIFGAYGIWKTVVNIASKF